MTPQEEIAQLSHRYGKSNRIDFELANQKFPVVKVNNDAAAASVALYGAHVMSYQPHGQPPVLWLSRAAKLEDGKSIRGGIPVCWPWFGPHPQDTQMPVHGFARIVAWHLELAVELDANTTELTFRLTDQDIAPSFCPQSFMARLQVRIGKTLQVGLEFINTGTNVMTCTAGLHTYFNIHDIGKIQVRGVDGRRYFNKVSGHEEIQHGELSFTGRVDRIYHDITKAQIEDPGLARIIEVEVSGGHSIVVWNPGAGIEKQFPGFAVGDERSMVCVEAANPGDDAIVLHPGMKHTLSTIIHGRSF